MEPRRYAATLQVATARALGGRPTPEEIAGPTLDLFVGLGGEFAPYDEAPATQWKRQRQAARLHG